ncbi:uncharacterized protein IL334_004417 [Kwoniella shivajii]|uniref:Pentatricopeptide repeat protein n=1 Tax=Kwoniella shivajii TaxID=564305 RepID=A0ABZ1D399_9TREE|nr:hypothetical protein IL334_004417 [Kwoniella shivajii]
MPPPHLPLTARSRAILAHPSNTTLSHVLGLVQNGYLDTASRVAVAQIRRNSAVASQSIGTGIISRASTSSPSLERRSLNGRHSIRMYSASAAQIIDHEEHHSDSSSSTYHRYNSPLSSSPLPSSSLHSPSSRRSKYKSKKSSANTGITKDKRFFRSLDLPDEWSLLPDDFYSRLRNGAFQSASHFSHDFDQNHFDTTHLGSIGNLLAIFDLFKQTAEHEDWIWLSTKLNRLSEVLSAVKSRQKGLSSLICSIRSYALISMGENEEAIKILERIQYFNESGYHSQPTTHVIASLTYIQMGDWDLALREMMDAINRGVQRVSPEKDQKSTNYLDYPSFDLALIKEYEQAVLNAGRNEDLIEIVRQSSFAFRKYLINSTQHHHGHSMAFPNIFFDALSRIGSPVEWWNDEFARSSDPQTRTLGVFIFIALTRDRSRIRDAITLLNIFIENGTAVPSTAAINLCFLVMTESTKDAWKLYQRVCEAYPNFTHHALSQALRLAGQAGWIEEEKRIWNELSTKHVPTFRDRITAASYHAYRGRVADTMSILENRVGKDFECNPQALQVLFTAYINANNSDGAQAVLNQLNDIEPQIYPYNALLQLYADQGNVNAAVKLFDDLVNSTLSPTIHSYTALISLFAHRRDPVNAENVFKAMIDAGIEPDAIAHAAVINAEVEAGDFLAALTRYRQLSTDIQRDKSIASAIIKALVLLSAPTEHVINVFRRIREPSRQAWALVIQNASDAGEMEYARELYEEMDQAAREKRGPRPDAYAFSILLHGYMRLGDGSSARAVYDEMLKREVLPSSVTYGMIVKSFAEARGERSLEQAHDFAINVSKQAKAGNIADRRHEKATVNENIFSPLVVAHGRNQNFEMAQTYFDLINEGDQKESVHAYTQIMDVYRRSGDVEKVLEIWNKTFQFACDTTSFRPPLNTKTETENGHSEEEAMRPTRSNDNILCIPLSIVLDCLSNAGKYYEVKKVWNQVESSGFGFDAGNYNHLSVALARTGDIEGAFMIADQILLKRYEEIKFRKNESMRESKRLPSINKLNSTNINYHREMGKEEMSQLIDEAITDEGQSGLESDGDMDVDMDIGIVDRPVEPTFGPPNRRHVFHGRSPFTVEARSDPMSELELKLLSNWRPTDVLWKPSLLTISVLDTAYAQLEDAKARRAWLPLAISESDENENEDTAIEARGGEEGQRKRRTYGVVLPLFGNVPVRNHLTGAPHRKGPTELLKSINRRYSRLVGLIMFHRRKRMARKIRDRQGR